MNTVKSLYTSELRHTGSNKIVTGDFIRFWRSFVEKKYFAEQSATMKVSEQVQTVNQSFTDGKQHVKEVEHSYKPRKDDVGQFNLSIKQFVSSNQSNLETYGLTNHLITQNRGNKIPANNALTQTADLLNMNSETSLGPYKQTKSEPAVLTSFFERELKQPVTKEAVKVTVLNDRVELHIRDAGLSVDALKNQLAELKFLVKRHFNISLASVSLNGQKVWGESDDLISKNNILSQYSDNESSVAGQTDSVIDKMY